MQDSDNIHHLKPWVNLAVFCRDAIVEEGTKNLSVIKIVDSVTLAGMTKDMTPTPVQLTMALILKSGEMKGPYNIKVRCNSPSGVQTTGHDISIYFEGDDRGIQTVFPMFLLAIESGIYWFDVLLEDVVLTRVSLRVLYQQLPMQPGMTDPSGMGKP